MIEQLKKYVEENDLQNKAIESFWVAFNNWKVDCPEEYADSFMDIPENKLDIFVHSIGLRSSEWPECDYNHVAITVLIDYNGQSLGSYRAFFSLSEDVDDDDILDIWYGRAQKEDKD